MVQQASLSVLRECLPSFSASHDNHLVLGSSSLPKFSLHVVEHADAYDPSRLKLSSRHPYHQFHLHVGSPAGSPVRSA
jgi:hypothetical protein